MIALHINTIEQVISQLDEIIYESEITKNPLGYFAVLYRTVTIKVKEGIENNLFDDGSLMEQLDIIFACRYLNAYYSWQNNEPVSKSWQKAFELSTGYWPIVLQHLLFGMNAHINLDLGIAAAKVSRNKNLNDLENDFNKINEILSSLVIKVQNDLAVIWPLLKKILDKTGIADDFFVDFSMELARDGAWKFAQYISKTPKNNIKYIIDTRDIKIAKKASLITNSGFVAKLIFGIIRLGEKGTVDKRIRQLASV